MTLNQGKIRKDYDAVVVGSGPNGLAAAITMQQQGLSVLLIEGASTIGGGMRSGELTLPGFIHDHCSAVHPLAIESKFFRSLPLHEHGLEFVYPAIPVAHPLDNGDAVAVYQTLEETIAQFDEDNSTYRKFVEPLIRNWDNKREALLAPFELKNLFTLAAFGIKGLLPVYVMMKRLRSERSKALLAGMAAHSMLTQEHFSTSAITMVLLATAHRRGWPIAKGGSISIAKALESYFTSIGGKIQTGTYINSLQELPSSHVVMFDVTPRQLLRIAGHKFSSFYRRQLQDYRYGMGVFKIDWALNAPAPWASEKARNAGTVHIGGTYKEIAFSEVRAWNDIHADQPFVLFSQPSVFDASRAPSDKHTAWAYCHVPNGSSRDMTDVIESQVERFAPGFRERILARHTMNAVQMEEYNPNYVGGDINGGVMDLNQLFTRPALRWSPYRTSAKGLYICSSSTPPGGGVHGMCGYHAARRALKDIFGKQP